MLKTEKEQTVNQLAGIISGAKGIYLTDFTGLGVRSITELRRKLRESSASYRVVKNTLARLAVERARLTDVGQAGVNRLKDFLDGPTGIAYTESDPVVPAKVLIDFAKKDQRPKIKSALVDGRVFTPEQVASLAALPSKKELLSQLLGGVRAPLSLLVGCLQELPRRLIDTLKAIESAD